MLFFRLASIFFLAGVQIFVAADDTTFAPPELLATDGDSPALKPYIGKPVSAESTVDDKVIRGLLKRIVKRQSCPGGYGLCNDGGCCPVGGQCCGGNKCCPAGQWCYSTGCCDINENGCEGVSCCPFGTECCKGGGCCDAGYYCAVVNGQKGCCPNGKICTSTGNNGGCVNTGYEPCPGDNFCCPAGYTCYRDGANNPQCSYSSSPNTYTYTTTTTSPKTTTTPNGNNNPPTISTTTTTPPHTTLNYNSTSSKSSSTTPASNSNPTSGFPASGASSGAMDWKVTWRVLGVAPVLVLVGGLL